MPVLREVATGKSKAVGNDRFVVARSSRADLRLRDPKCDDQCHFSIIRQPSGYVLNPEHGVSINGREIRGKSLINAGDRISLGSTLLVFEELPCDQEETQLANEVIGNATFQQAIEIRDGQKIVLGRDTSRLVHRLNHPMVSRKHAEVSNLGRINSIRDLSSSNGTFVNGLRIVGTIALNDQDVIGIGPYVFRVVGHRLLPCSSLDRAAEQKAGNMAALTSTQLTCSGLNRTLLNSNRELLKDIHLQLQPGTLAAIIGPSGSGKSTLLKALGNREPIGAGVSKSGQIRLGEFDLQGSFEQIKKLIAFVPQQEILFEDLKLRDALMYSAALRLPEDTTSIELTNQVEQVLATVSLTMCQHTRIDKLSGGQRKRAALAGELLAEPSLLLLDEVTSGLDELTDAEMMALFARIASTGKVVVCVTHCLSAVLDHCNQIVALSQHGRLAFAGTPAAALQFFDVSRLRDIYPKLMADTPVLADKIASQFRDVSQQTSSATLGEVAHNENLSKTPSLQFTAFSLKQFRVLAARYAQRMCGDRHGLFLRLMQIVCVMLLLGMVFGREPTGLEQINCAFVLSLSCYWFGCNNSAKEIVAERSIFEHERSVAVRLEAYAYSKFMVLSLLSLVQAFVLLAAVHYWCHLSGEFSSWIMLCCTMALAGTATGLAISANARSQEAAVAAVPIVLIPQIILAGAVATLSGLSLWLAKLMITSYWGLEAAKEILQTSADFSSTMIRSFAIVIIQMGLALYLMVRGLQNIQRP